MQSIRAEDPRLRQIMMITQVSRALTDVASLDEILQLTVDRAAELLSAETSLLLVVDEAGLLALRSSHGVDAALAHRVREPLDETLIPRLARLLDAPPESLLGVPLVVSGTIMGILVVTRPALASDVAAQDEWLLSALADQAAVALEKVRLGEIAEFRERLIGIVGHDLRTPLNTIRMGAYLLLQRDGLGEIETELARKITRSALRAERLIGQLLDLTRSRLGGGIPIDRRSFDLNEVCRELVSETELAHPDRPLSVEIRGRLVGVWDRDRIYQLLANLVGNAVRHGEPRSTIQLRIDGGDDEVVIEVANRGTPIPPATLPFIFEAFRQGRTNHRSEGLGLGLFIAQQIARAHGGSISATSSAREGTTFRVRLPRGPVVTAEQGLPSSGTEGPTATSRR